MVKNKNTLKKIFTFLFFSIIFIVLIPSMLLASSSTNKKNEENIYSSGVSNNNIAKDGDNDYDQFDFSEITTYGQEEWYDHYYAPYVDFSAYDGTSPYKGAPSLKGLSEAEKAQYYNLGFIQSTGGFTNTEQYGEIANWGWGASSVLSEDGNDGWQYMGINQSINEFREVGGDITISFGGAANNPFWLVGGITEEILVNTYEYIIDGYNLTLIDLDIEEDGQDAAANALNAKAIKQVQEDTGVRVSITLPSADTGLISLGMNALQPYINEGVDIETVNIMTMYMGDQYAIGGSNENGEGQATIAAINGLADQLVAAYEKAGRELTLDEAYSMVGVTNTIGFENSYHFDTTEAREVIDYAIEANIGMLSFWCANRDAQKGMYTTNNGTYDPYEFGTMYRDFEDHNDDGGDPDGGGGIEIDTTPPDAPTSFTTESVTSTNIVVKWNPSPSDDVSYYEADLITGGEVIETETVSANSSNLMVNFEGLTSGTTYTINVYAIDYAGNKSTALTKDFTTTVVDNQGPTFNGDSVTLTPGTTTIDVEFDKATDDSGSVKEYKVVLDNGAKIETISDDGSETYNTQFTGLEPKSTHTISITAYDNSQNASQPWVGNVTLNEEDNVAPNAPTNLASDNITEDSATISWDAATDSDGTISGYAIAYAKQGHTIPNAIEIGNVTSYTLDNLDANTTYDAFVYSIDDKGLYSSSSKITFTTSESEPIDTIAPQNVHTTEITTNSISVEWDHIDNTLGYEVAIVEGKDNTTVNDSDWIGIGSKTQYKFINLESDTDYTIHIRRTDYNYGKAESHISVKTESNGSTEVDTEAPILPSMNELALRPTSTSNSITINWNNGATDNTALDYYELSITEGQEIDWSNSEKVYLQSGDDWTTSFSHTFNGLKPSTYYTIGMRVVDVAGNISNNVITLGYGTKDSTDTEAPTTPVVSIDSEDITNSTANVSWTSTDNIDDELTYTVNLFKGDENSTNLIDSITTTDTSWTFTNLNSSTDYTVKVIARDVSFNFSETGSATFTTDETFGVVSTLPPENLMATDITPGSIYTRWEAIDGVEYYQVSIIKDNKKTFYTTQDNGYEFINLNSNSTYVIGVSGVYSDGTVTNESLLQVTTLGVENFDKVENVSTEISSNGKSATVSWDEVHGASQYIVRYRAIGGEKSNERISQNNWETVSVSETSIVLSDLNPNSTYQITVSAADNNGDYDSSISRGDINSFIPGDLNSKDTPVGWIIVSVIAIVAATISVTLLIVISSKKKGNKNSTSKDSSNNDVQIF